MCNIKKSFVHLDVDMLTDSMFRALRQTLKEDDSQNMNLKEEDVLTIANHVSSIIADSLDWEVTDEDTNVFKGSIIGAMEDMNSDEQDCLESTYYTIITRMRNQLR